MPAARELAGEVGGVVERLPPSMHLVAEQPAADDEVVARPRSRTARKTSSGSRTRSSREPP